MVVNTWCVIPHYPRFNEQSSNNGSQKASSTLRKAKQGLNKDHARFNRARRGLKQVDRGFVSYDKRLRPVLKTYSHSDSRKLTLCPQVYPKDLCVLHAVPPEDISFGNWQPTLPS